MPGTVLSNGQNWILDQLMGPVNNSGLWVGLMQETATISETAQINAGISEISVAPTGSGYQRKPCIGWTKVGGTDPYISGPTVTFDVKGIWPSVNGYFVATSSTINSATALWAEPFPSGKFGDKTDGDVIIITPKYQQTDYSE